MTKEEQSHLLQLARKTLQNQFNPATPGVAPPVATDQPAASFVTLTKNGQLRGCIGTLEAFEPLYKDIERNTLSAAFSDSRFSPLQQSELNAIKIEISVLSRPEPVVFSDADDLIKKIKPNLDGIIISADGKSATFLPQVWDQLPEKELFLSSLCQKAGLLANRWQNPGLAVEKYQVESFSE